MKKKVSIIIPVFNEADSIGPFLRAMTETVCCLEYDFEFIFIDDGSSDGTLFKIHESSVKDKRIKYIELSRNYGKEVALTAGLDYAIGDCAIPIDVDLQDPPNVIVEMLGKWEEGFDVVYGVRESRKTDTIWKRLTSGLFYKTFNAVSDIKIPENAGDFRLLDRKVLKALSLIGERNRFMKGLFSWVGFKQTAVYFARDARMTGVSKWRYWRLWNFAMDGIFSFGSWPLRIWTYIGMAIAMLGLIYGIVLTLKVLVTGVDVPGYASIIVTVLFMGGVQLLTLGLIGEYVGRLYTEVKQRPLYIVKGSSYESLCDSCE